MSQLFASGGQSIGVSASTSGICHSFSKSLWSSLAASWEGLGAGGEGDDRGWDGWMTSLTRWTWVWVNSRSWWWTGRPGVLQFMGLQRVEHDWATEPNWTELNGHLTPKLTFSAYSVSYSVKTFVNVLQPSPCNLRSFYHLGQITTDFWLVSSGNCKKPNNEFFLRMKLWREKKKKKQNSLPHSCSL